MKETMMSPAMHAPLTLARVAVCLAVALAILVSPVSAATSVDQTWNAEHAELVRRAYGDEDGLANYLVVKALGGRFS